MWMDCFGLASAFEAEPLTHLERKREQAPRAPNASVNFRPATCNLQQFRRSRFGVSPKPYVRTLN
jgi:hypothetical protein